MQRDLHYVGRGGAAYTPNWVVSLSPLTLYHVEVPILSLTEAVSRSFPIEVCDFAS